MSTRDLPPLALLPAFEAAGRLGSFTRAAGELHLTPSAVSQQIKALEGAVGAALFNRNGPSVQLSKVGESFHREVSEALQDLVHARRRLQRRSKRHVLTISTSDFISYEFLLPRLATLRARHPTLELRVETTTRLVNLEDGQHDAAIRLGTGPWPGLVCRQIGTLVATPVCGLRAAKELKKLEQLRDYVLLEVDGQERRGWHVFYKKMGVPRAAMRVSSCDSYLETMRAAQQGLGVAFAVFPLTMDWVASGRLAVPFAIRLPLSARLWLAHRKLTPHASQLDQLLDWLREEFRNLPALPDGRVVVRNSGPHGQRRVRTNLGSPR